MGSWTAQNAEGAGKGWDVILMLCLLGAILLLWTIVAVNAIESSPWWSARSIRPTPSARPDSDGR